MVFCATLLPLLLGAAIACPVSNRWPKKGCFNGGNDTIDDAPPALTFDQNVQRGLEIIQEHYPSVLIGGVRAEAPDRHQNRATINPKYSLEDYTAIVIAYRNATHFGRFYSEPSHWGQWTVPTIKRNADYNPMNEMPVTGFKEADVRVNAAAAIQHVLYKPLRTGGAKIITLQLHARDSLLWFFWMTDHWEWINARTGEPASTPTDAETLWTQFV